MPEIIPPKNTKKKSSKKTHRERLSWVYLVLGMIAIVWGLLLLLDIALGLLLLLLGFTAVNQWLMKE